MKYIICFISLLFLQSCLIGSGENSKIEESKIGYFPKINGINLKGEKQQLPKAFKGKLNLVAVAFKREQQQDVDSWIVAFEEIDKETPDINFYEIPLIYELNTFSRTWVNNGMRFGVKEENARNRTITVYTKRDQFLELMKMKEENIYLLLLNNEGKILWQNQGLANNEKINQLKLFIKKITK